MIPRERKIPLDKVYGMPLRIKVKTVKAVHLLVPRHIPFNRKLWIICQELAKVKGLNIEQIEST